jgi:hypothetical protein
VSQNRLNTAALWLDDREKATGNKRPHSRDAMRARQWSTASTEPNANMHRMSLHRDFSENVRTMHCQTPLNGYTPNDSGIPGDMPQLHDSFNIRSVKARIARHRLVTQTYSGMPSQMTLRTAAVFQSVTWLVRRCGGECVSRHRGCNSHLRLLLQLRTLSAANCVHSSRLDPLCAELLKRRLWLQHSVLSKTVSLSDGN